MKYRGDAVISCRVDRRTLATLVEFYKEYDPAGTMTLTRASLIKRGLEDFSELLASIGKIELVQSTEEADIVLRDQFGPVSMNASNRGRQNYMESLQESNRLREDSFWQPGRRETEESSMVDVMNQKAKEAGFDSYEEWSQQINRNVGRSAGGQDTGELQDPLTVVEQEREALRKLAKEEPE